MKKIKYLVTSLLACAMVCMAPSCSKDDPDGGGNGDPGSVAGEGDYGKLGDNMVATGGTRAVSYTQAILLGTVDFSKLSDTHTYGVVYMQGVEVLEGQKEFDYTLNLAYGKDDVVDATVSPIGEGRFEKQLIDLMPGTTYYYRSYIKIGSNYNYSDVKSFSTLDPSSQINLVTGDPEEVCALSTVMVGRGSIGNVNNGLDQIEIQKQEFGFIYSDDASLGTPETLTMEYWENWDNTHFDTQIKPDEPKFISTTDNMNSVLRKLAEKLIPGTTYYYRTAFKWNDRYFYSPEVKSFTTLGVGSLPVGTLKAEDITSTSARLKGHVPYEKIGAKTVYGGFMISKYYSHSSEFVMTKDMRRWPSYDDISYVDCVVDEVDFDTEITDLEPDTQYYVCAYIHLGREKGTVDKYDEDNKIEGKEIYVYGDVMSFKTEKYGASTGGAEIEISMSDSYPWTENNGTYTSGNAGVDSSTSGLEITVTPTKSGLFSFDWTVSSEQNYDKFKISVNGAAPDEHSGNDSGTFTKTMSANREYVVTVTYTKDNTGSSGSDCATVSNIRFN